MSHVQPACVRTQCRQLLLEVDLPLPHVCALRLAGAGDGGYGRLGHSVQQDEHEPRQIDTFKGRMPVAPASLVSSALAAATNACPCTGDALSWPASCLQLASTPVLIVRSADAASQGTHLPSCMPGRWPAAAPAASAAWWGPSCARGAS